MKLLDLFSGIGGFSLAAEYNNIETIGFVEKDKFCHKVLQKNFPGIPIIGDIRDVKRDTFEAVDIISGGFPCQPFSVAGKQKGRDDDRYLWDETIRVVAECKPRWFIGENVDGLVNIQNGLVLRQVQDDLEAEGFQVQCLVIPAASIGAWHQRKRVWIIGHNVCESEHNGSSTATEQRGNTQTSTGSQKRENSSLQSERTGRPTDNGNVSDTECLGFSERSSIRGLHKKEPNDSDKFSDKSKTRTEERNVSNTQHQRWIDESIRGHRALGEESRGKEKKGDQSALCSSARSSERGKNKYWRWVISNSYNSRFKQSNEKMARRSSEQFDSRSIQPRQDQKNIQYSHDQRLQEHQLSQKSEEQRLNSGGLNAGEKPTQSWWEIESNLCGVPNGVSYGLDKGRVNRIKSLGNSIVPQIAYQLFKSICVAEEYK